MHPCANPAPRAVCIVVPLGGVGQVNALRRRVGVIEVAAWVIDMSIRPSGSVEMYGPKRSFLIMSVCVDECDESVLDFEPIFG